MALLCWEEKYSVKIKSIDDQHKKLMEYINEFDEAVKTQQDKNIISPLLNHLVAYTINHFSFEEKLFEEFSYKDRSVHSEQHKELVKKIKSLQNQYEKEDLEISNELMIFLKEWWQGHILGTDMMYSQELVEKGVE